MTKIDYNEYIADHTMRCEASDRGGGIEIDLNDLLKINRGNDDNDYFMSAYQNYLGGGMLGSIQSNCNFDYSTMSETRQNKIIKMADALKRHFHDLTNHVDDEWEETTFERGQYRPASAY